MPFISMVVIFTLDEAVKSHRDTICRFAVHVLNNLQHNLVGGHLTGHFENSAVISFFDGYHIFLSFRRIYMFIQFRHREGCLEMCSIARIATS